MAEINNVDKQRMLRKMRVFRDKRDEELVENKKTNNKIENIQYLGIIKVNKEIGGKIIEQEKDIFLSIENINGKNINKVYTEDMELLGIEDENYGFLPNKKNINNADKLKKIEENTNNDILDLKTMSDQEIEVIIKTLNIKKEDLNKIVELDLNQDIEKQKKGKEESQIGEKDTQNLVNGKQEINLDTFINDKETIGQKLGLQENEYTKIVVVDSSKIRDIDSNADVNNTRYSFIAIKVDGTAVTINDKLQLDEQTGVNGMDESLKIDADGTARKDNSNLSRYNIVDSDEYLSLENGDYGEVKVFYGGKTKDGEPVETELEGLNVSPTTRVLRDTQREEEGDYNLDKINDEAESHFLEGEKKLQLKDVDGDLNTKTHNHIDPEVMEVLVDIIMKNEKISEIYSREEIEETLENAIKLNPNLTLKEILKRVEKDLEQEASKYPSLEKENPK